MASEDDKPGKWQLQCSVFNQTDLFVFPIKFERLVRTLVNTCIVPFSRIIPHSVMTDDLFKAAQHGDIDYFKNSEIPLNTSYEKSGDTALQLLQDVVMRLSWSTCQSPVPMWKYPTLTASDPYTRPLKRVDWNASRYYSNSGRRWTA